MRDIGRSDTKNFASLFNRVGSDEQVKGRVSFCKFVLASFWNRSEPYSPIIRNSILNFSIFTQNHVLRQRNPSNNNNDEYDDLDKLVLNSLLDTVESTGMVDVPLFQYSSILDSLPNDSKLATRFIKLFSANLFRGMPQHNKNINLLRGCKSLARFINDPSFVEVLVEWATEHEGKTETGSLDELRRDLFSIARLRDHNCFPHILNDQSIIASAKTLIPVVVASVNIEQLEQYFAELEFERPFEAFICDDDHAADFKDNKLFKIAAIATHNGFWFDTWCVDQLRSLLTSSSSFTEKKSESAVWYRLEQFLAVIANAARTIRADQDRNEINPIFHFLIETGLVLFEDNRDRVYLYNVIARSIFSSSLPTAVRALAGAREHVLEKQIPDVSTLISDLFDEYEKGILKIMPNIYAAERGDGEDDGERQDEEPLVTSWSFGSPQLVLRFGGVDMLDRINIIGKDRCYCDAIRSCQVGPADRLTSNFIKDWNELLQSGQPLDMRHVNLLFSRVGFVGQQQLIRYLINRGQYINEEALDGKAVATFMFETLTRGRIINTKPIVEILDLGTRFASDPGAFISAYGADVDSAIRYECGMGNVTAIEVAKRCADAIRSTEQFQEQGPFKVFDSIFKFDPNLQDPKAAGLFKPLYEQLASEVIPQEEGEEGEEDNNNNAVDDGKYEPKTSVPYDRLYYLTSQRKMPGTEQPKMTPSEVEDFLRFTLDGASGGPSARARSLHDERNLRGKSKFARLCMNTTSEEAARILSIAPAVCSNATLQNAAIAAKITIPRIVTAIRNDVSEDELRDSCGISDPDKIKHMKSGAVRVELDTNGSSRNGWAYLEFDENQHSCFVLKVNASALAQPVVPEDLTLSAELETILNFWNEPKLFNPNL
jgi:hypothetical protein